MDSRHNQDSAWQGASGVRGAGMINKTCVDIVQVSRKRIANEIASSVSLPFYVLDERLLAISTSAVNKQLWNESLYVHNREWCSTGSGQDRRKDWKVSSYNPLLGLTDSALRCIVQEFTWMTCPPPIREKSSSFDNQARMIGFGLLGTRDIIHID